MTDSLRFPIGKFIFGAPADAAEIPNWIKDIQQLPQQINELIKDWSPEMFRKIYRPDGWTGAQVIHHLADSHVNAYIRFKLALTENVPTVKPYDEAAWAALPDGNDFDAAPSLQMLAGVHQRWTTCLKNMSAEDFNKCFFHPGLKRELKLTQNLALYSWHSRHHLGHLKIIDQEVADNKSL